MELWIEVSGLLVTIVTAAATVAWVSRGMISESAGKVLEVFNTVMAEHQKSDNDAFASQRADTNTLRLEFGEGLRAMREKMSQDRIMESRYICQA